MDFVWMGALLALWAALAAMAFGLNRLEGPDAMNAPNELNTGEGERP
ncbi:hypothetical protein QFZ42_005380 [Variovorax paradoxus]|nr:hypothetical protein [Variovorax paradoxus]MDQ0573546.1 hypothetical protein [Variovorax paradoxus]